MTLPKSLDAYEDCEAYFQKALSNPNGIKITFSSQQECTKAVHKMNGYRVALRRRSKSIYDPTHPDFGRSIFDALEISKDKENPCACRIKKYEIRAVSIEDL